MIKLADKNYKNPHKKVSWNPFCDVILISHSMNDHFMCQLFQFNSKKSNHEQTFLICLLFVSFYLNVHHVCLMMVF